MICEAANRKYRLPLSFPHIHLFCIIKWKRDCLPSIHHRTLASRKRIEFMAHDQSIIFVNKFLQRQVDVVKTMYDCKFGLPYSVM